MDQAEMLSSWHLGVGESVRRRSGVYSPPEYRTAGEPSAAGANVSSVSLPLSGGSRQECASPPGGVSDVQRRVTESQAVVKVHAVCDDGSNSCTFDFNTSLSTFADFQANISDRLKLKQFACTYSTSPQFLSMRTVNPYRQQMLTSDLELSCAVMSTDVHTAPTLYVRAHQHLAGDLLSLSGPRLSRTASLLVSPSSDGWDLMEDSTDVKQLWRQLPAATSIPFARLLQWHLRQPLNQVSKTMQSIAHRLPLHGFELASFFDESGCLVREADFRLRVYHGGVAPEVRPPVWRHLLYVFPPHLTRAEREVFLEERRAEFFHLRDEWKTVEEPSDTIKALMCTIQNDVVRTDRLVPCFVDDNSPYLKALFNILMTFALNDPIISYVQGLNDIVSILLRVFDGDEADTYIAFHSFMQCTRLLFTPDGLSLKFAHLTALLQRFDSVFFDYLCRTKSQDLFFCYRWLLLDMKREFEMTEVPRLFEVLWSTLPPPTQYMTSLKKTPESESPVSVDLPASPASADTVNSSVDAAGAVTPRVARKSEVETTTPQPQRILVRDFGSSPANSWTVIDCLPDAVCEVDASELTASDQRSVEAVEEARDATTLSLTLSMQVEAVEASRVQSFSEDVPVAGTPASVVSGDWDVVGSEEAALAAQAPAVHMNNGLREAGMVMVAEPTVAAHRSPSKPIQVKDEAAAQPSPANLPNSVESDTSPPETPPSTYGSPFSLFLCIAVMLEHRNIIMRHGIAEESIAMYFDKLRGSHDASAILDRARSLLSIYVAVDLDSPMPDAAPMVGR